METGLAKILQVLSISPCFSLFTVLFAYVVFFWLVILWLGICIDVAVDRILPSPPLLTPSLFVLFCFVFFPGPTYNALSNTSDSYFKSVRA